MKERAAGESERARRGVDRKSEKVSKPVRERDIMGELSELKEQQIDDTANANTFRGG
jgi:hypothetical protein